MRADAEIGRAVGLVALAGGCTAVMMVGRSHSDLLFYAAALGGSLVSLAAARDGATSGRAALAVVVAGAVLLRLALVVTTPSLSGDLYRYIWDGRVTAAGLDPYTHVPADPALVGLRDPAQYGLIDKRDYAVSLYPPVAQAIFVAVTSLSTSLTAMKLAMVLFEGTALIAVVRLLRRLGRPPGAVAGVLLHPAGLWEVAGNGHLDAAAAAFLFGALAWGGGPRRPYGAAVAMALGALVKPTVALGLPALWTPWRVVLPLVVILVTAACYLPFIGAGPGILGFLPGYAHEQGLDSGTGILWLALAGHVAPLPPGAPAGYAGVAGLLLLGAALWTRRTGAGDLTTGLRGTAALLIAAVLLATPIFPWYWLALLPFWPLLGLWTPFALATLGFLLYGFNADAPPFLLRWSLVFGVAAVCACRDGFVTRHREMLP